MSDESRHFLLGQLDEPTRADFEARLLQDAGAYEEMLATEGELLEEWARGELSASESQAVAALAGRLEDGTERVATAGALAHLADRRAAQALAPQGLDRQASEDSATVIPFARRRPGAEPETQRPSQAESVPWFWRAAAIAAGLLLVLAGFVFWRAVETGQRLHRLEAEYEALLAQRQASEAAHDDLTRQLEGRQLQVSELNEQLQGSEQRLQELERELSLVRSTAGAVTSPLKASFLLAMAVRGGSEDASSEDAGVVPKLRLTSLVDIVALEVDLEGLPLDPPYRARLRQGGAEAWSRGQLHLGEFAALQFEVPASLLTAGRWQLQLTSAGGEKLELELDVVR